MTSERFGAVVGIDGSAGSDAALAWAVAHADRLGTIRPVHAWDYPPAVWVPGPFYSAPVPPVDQMQAAAEEAARTSSEDALRDVIHQPPMVRRGTAAAVLLAESSDARVLIVGTRGRGPVADALLGSVGRRCADKTTIPLVIVPHRDASSDPPHQERIVVGVDGSVHAEAALAWSLELAGGDDEIIAVTTWSTPLPVGIDAPRFDLTALRAAAQHTVDLAADKACADAGVPPERITRSIAEGDARWVLKEMQADADLLVLGARGHTGISHLILGSTTSSLIHSPSCPIAVVP